MMTWRVLLMAIMSAFLVTPNASALSCMRPDLGAAMERAKESDKLYYIFVGTYRPQDPGIVTDYMPNNEKKTGPKDTVMWFDGRILGQQKWQDSVVRQLPVTVKTSCAGPWCSSPPRGGEKFIAFVEARSGQPALLRIGPCPEWLFRVDPNGRQLDLLRDCFDKPCQLERQPY